MIDNFDNLTNFLINNDFFQLYVKFLIVTIVLDMYRTIRMSNFIMQMCGVDPFKLNELEESVTYRADIKDILKKFITFIPVVNMFYSMNKFINQVYDYETFENFIEKEQEKKKSRS